LIDLMGFFGEGLLRKLYYAWLCNFFWMQNVSIKERKLGWYVRCDFLLLLFVVNVWYE
jgi:hypothetical protein